MSDDDAPRILTDENGHALAVVSGGELHPVVRLPRRVPGQTLGPWADMSETELLLAMTHAGEAIALYRRRVEEGEELGNLLAHAAGELTDIEDELIRRGFSGPGA
jgi:hypothetical protein